MPSISHAEALSIINHYGSVKEAANALKVSQSALRKLAGLTPTRTKTDAKTVSNIASAIAALPARERKQVEMWTEFFSQASENMIRKFENQSPQLKNKQRNYFEQLYKKWQSEKRDVPDSTLQYWIWKAIMRKAYETKAQSWTI